MKKIAMRATVAAVAVASAFALTACGKKETSTVRYTYRDTAANPTTWSPTDWQNNDEGIYLDWTTSPFYQFVPNAAKNGHDIMPVLAEKMAEDVTVQYAGTHGIPADATSGYAWKIKMVENATWEDGTPISVKDVEYSIKQFLNPDMKNYRASTFYESLPLINARGYYEGTVAYKDANKIDGAENGTLYSSLENACVFFGGSMADYGTGSGYESYWTLPDGSDGLAIVEAAAGDSSYFVVTPEVLEVFKATAANFGDPNPLAFLEFCFVRVEQEATPWESVGFIKDDDYTFTWLFERPSTEFMFYYASTGAFLIKEDLYEAGKKKTGDIYKSTYGTAVEQYASYGPWKLEAFQADKSMHLVRNDSWFGYNDPRNKGMYQTTDIDIQFITDHETLKNLFLQGNLSTFSLIASDMDEYANSDYRDETPQSYTYKLSFNIDRKSLEREDKDGINHSIIANLNFRHAISLSMNRSEWCVTTSPASQPGFGLINYMYVAVPETGLLYRDTQQAIDVLTNFYGVSDLKDITGYDLVAAKEYFQKAYDEEVAAGHLAPTDKIAIDYHAYSNSEGNQKRVSFVQDSINKATAGTSLEGKVSVNLIVDQDYYDNMKTGAVDLALTAWGGSAFDPYGILQCYTTEQYLNEYGLDPYTEKVTIKINGKDRTETLNQWYELLCNGEYADASNDVKNTILAACEGNLLSRYNMIPLEYNSTLTLHSQRYVDYSEDYINPLVGRGGIRELTWTMNDEEWDAYCKQQNNKLKY